MLGAMKRLHRPDLFCWSTFREPLNIDFNGFLWVRPGGNVMVDPLPLSAHDRAHLAELGGVATVVITNSMHVRGAAELGDVQLIGPAAEREGFPLPCHRWVGDGEEIVPGLVSVAFDGSKTPGELGLVLEETTLITGDLIRAHRAGGLMWLKPEQRLQDLSAARASLRKVLERHRRLENVLVGDGWCLFGGAARALEALLAD